MGNFVSVVFDNFIKPVAIALKDFSYWFYLIFLPFILQYIAIPFFILGIIIALAFAGGTLLFILVFTIFIFFFIKGTIFSSTP